MTISDYRYQVFDMSGTEVIKEYVCPECGKTWDNPNSLVAHRLRSHRVPPHRRILKLPEPTTKEEAIVLINHLRAELEKERRKSKLLWKLVKFLMAQIGDLK